MNPLPIGNRLVGSGLPVYVIAELSANHLGSLDRAKALVKAAAAAGANAVKLQTYTADTLTLDCRSDLFRHTSRSQLWSNEYLYDLYQKAYTPWDWYGPLQEVAHECGLQIFSTPFDPTAVDFLEAFEPVAYKISSFELIDLPLIKYTASKQRPMLISTGMGSLREIQEAVDTVKAVQPDPQLILLRCNSSYPAPVDGMHLATLKDLQSRFDLAIGLSDHTRDVFAAVTAVAMGACVIEKHLTLSRDLPTADCGFSLEPAEFAEMVQAVRTVESVIGRVNYGPSESESESYRFRRSLFVVRDIPAGVALKADDIRSIRPGQGLSPKYLDQVIGKLTTRSLSRGEPLQVSDIVGLEC
jgi:pseudaminic acid synthase